MAQGIRVTILKDIKPKGWSSVFYARTARFEYDSKSPTRKKIHQLIYQQGPRYGQVGDMCESFTHDELLELERQGFVRIHGMKQPKA